jgi:hypothetical protein
VAACVDHLSSYVLCREHLAPLKSFGIEPVANPAEACASRLPSSAIVRRRP